MTDDDFLRASAVSCERLLGGGAPSRVRALSLSIRPGALTLLRGGAGSGKNLALRLLGLLETPDAGEVYLRGTPTRALPDAARVEMRNRHFGFVFSEPFLLEGLSIAENIAMPLFKISGTGVEEARARTERLLGFAGLNGGGAAAGLAPLEQQKVSLARALAHSPEIVLVENVDARLAGGELAEFIALLRAARGAFGVTVIASATAADAVPDAECAFTFSDGAISQTTPEMHPHSIPAPAGSSGGARP